MDLAFGCRRVVFEWEGFSLESFQNDTSLSLILLLDNKLVLRKKMESALMHIDIIIDNAIRLTKP